MRRRIDLVGWDTMPMMWLACIVNCHAFCCFIDILVSFDMYGAGQWVIWHGCGWMRVTDFVVLARLLVDCLGITVLRHGFYRIVRPLVCVDMYWVGMLVTWMDIECSGAPMGLIWQRC